MVLDMFEQSPHPNCFAFMDLNTKNEMEVVKIIREHAETCRPFNPCPHVLTGTVPDFQLTFENGGRRTSDPRATFFEVWPKNAEGEAIGDKSHALYECCFKPDFPSRPKPKRQTPAPPPRAPPPPPNSGTPPSATRTQLLRDTATASPLGDSQ